MIIKTKKVYYCEFCRKKKGLNVGAMVKHELRCTANPSRVCGLCNKKGVDISIMKDKDLNKENLDSLIREVECPPCILAIIRQSYTKEQKQTAFESNVKYDYEQAMKDYWHEQQEKERYDWELTHGN